MLAYFTPKKIGGRIIHRVFLGGGVEEVNNHALFYTIQRYFFSRGENRIRYFALNVFSHHLGVALYKKEWRQFICHKIYSGLYPVMQYLTTVGLLTQLKNCGAVYTSCRKNQVYPTAQKKKKWRDALYMKLPYTRIYTIM